MSERKFTGHAGGGPAEAVRRLFDALVSCAPVERKRRLEAVKDAALRREVAALLEARGQDGGPVEALDEFRSLLGRPEPVAPPAGREDPLGLEGKQVGGYAVEEHLGGGGMGVVYRVRDTRLGRPVALKFLPPHLATHPEAKQRFVREAKAASALDHPNIGYMHEIDETEEGQLFIAMAYYAGETLKAKIACGPLPIEEAVAYAIQIAEGLAGAHAAGIIHRDVKPANVMVTEDGYVKIVDFGLARAANQSRLTDPGRRVGTAAYMSPEQAEGKAVDARADLWALGAVLYEMLTGKRPFRGAHPQSVIHSVLNEDPEPLRAQRLDVPDALATVVETLLRKDPDERYSDADSLRADLHAMQNGSREQRSIRRPLQRVPPIRLAATVAGLAVLLAFIGVFVVSPFSDASERQSAEPGGETSVAVLPLKNLSGDPQKEYLSDGMTDALIANLTTIDALRVISRTSAMRYKDAEAPMPQIAEELGVEYVVDGAVFSVEDSVRITASLVEAAADRALWTKHFTREMKGVLGL